MGLEQPNNLILENENRQLRRHIADLQSKLLECQGTDSSLARSGQDEAVALLDTLVNHAPIGFAFIDTDLRIRLINDRLAEFNGISAEATLGHTVEEIVPALAPQVREVVRRVSETGEAILDVEFSGETAGAPGQLRYWSESWYPIRSRDGRLLGVGAVVQEITQSKKTEQELQNANKSLEELSHRVAGITSWELEPESSQDSGAKAMLKVVGLDRNGSGDDGLLMSRVHPDDLALVTDSLKKCGLTGWMEVEYRYLYPGGQVRWFHMAGRTLGEKGKILGISRDITEHKRAEETLRRASEQQRLALEGAGLGTWDYQLDTGDVLWDERSCQIFGLPAADRIRYADFLSRLHPEDRAATDKAVKHAIAGDNGGTCDTEFRVVWLDGSVHWVAGHGRAFFAGEGDRRRAVRFSGVNMEITERKRAEEALLESEERFRLITETISEVFWISDRELTKMAYISPAYERIWGRSQASLYEDPQSFLEAVHPDDRSRTLQHIQSGMAQFQPLDHEYRIVSDDGSTKWIWDRGFPIFDSDRQARRYAGVATDITRRKELERELLQAQKLDSLGQLAAGIAHEINTPIQYIGDNAKFLEDSLEDLFKCVAPHPEVDVDYLRKEIPAAITQLQEGASQVAHIVRAMKEFSHLGSSEKSPADLNRAIENTILVSKNVWKYVADISTDLDPALPLVPCLIAELNQVILNLILNAAHAIEDMVKGSGQKGAIRIGTHQDGDWVEVRVTDTGCGIPEGIRSKVFDPFFTTKPVGKGTGQGLTIAHSIIVQKHAGTIAFDSNTGGGTTFLVRLPLGSREL